MQDKTDLGKLIKLKKKKRINSRTKGNAFERKISKLLNEHYNTKEFMRTPGSGAFATTHNLPEHLQIAGDLITPKQFPWLIECKKGYKFTISDLYNGKSDFWNIILKNLEQADKSKKRSLLIFQQDRQHILCCVEQTYLTQDFMQKNWYKLIKYGNFVIMSLTDFLDYVQPTL